MRVARVSWLLVVLGLAFFAAGCGNEPDYGSPLVKTPFERTHLKRLPDGGQVAVGSPDGHAVTVQWQDPKGKNWTKPEVAYREEKFWTHDINVTVAGKTVAIDPDYWTQQKLDDDYDPDHTAQVICHNRDCFPGHRTRTVLSGTTLNARGTFASFGLGDGKVLLWETDHGFRTETWNALPPHSMVGLVPGDNFFGVAGVVQDKGCRYDLYVTEPRRTTFSLAARSSVYVGHADSCDGNGRLVGKKIEVYVEGTSSRFDFVHKGSHWVADEPDFGLAAYPDTHGKHTLVVEHYNLQDGGQVAIGSPDARAIVVQTKPKGGTWSDPRVIAHAPGGQHCGQQTDLGVIGQAGALVRCYRDDLPAGKSLGPSSGFAVVTSDGSNWQALPLERPLEEPLVSPAATASIVAGATRSYIISSRGIKMLELPLNTPYDGITFAPGGRGVFGITGNEDRSVPCRPTWHVASFSADGWGPAHPIKLPADFPTHGRCFAAAYSSSGGAVSGEVGGVSPNYLWQFNARAKGDTYVFKGYRG